MSKQIKRSNNTLNRKKTPTLTARTPVKQVKRTSTRADYSQVDEYIKNMMDPERPFVTPGPSAWVTALNVTTYLPVPGTLSGFAIASPNITNTLVFPSSQPSLANWATGINNMPNLPLNTQVCISDSLNQAGNDELTTASHVCDQPGYFHYAHNTLQPGAKYYPGSYSITVAGSWVVTYNYQAGAGVVDLFIQGAGPNGFMGNAAQVPLPSNATSQVILGSALAGLTLSQGIAFYVRSSATWLQSNFSLNITMPTLTKGPDVASVTYGLKELLVTRPSLADAIFASVRHKVTAMSITLTNSTPLLNRGGFVSTMQLPSGSFTKLPSTPAVLYNYMSTAPSVYGKVAMDLTNGSHVYYVPDTFNQSEFIPTSVSVELTNRPTLLTAWSSTEPQSLTLKIRMNIELQTLNNNTPLKLRTPELRLLHDYMVGHCAMLEEQCGCNPDHVRRIANVAKKIIADPTVRRLAGAAVRALPGLMAMV